MDSLTQMALGASVGYAVAGKQWGHKALLWGAVGGTIPDLDVIGNFWLDEIEGLAFHRGFTHSITFILLGPLLMIPLFRYYYRFRWGTSLLMRWLKIILLVIAGIFGLGYSFVVGFVLLGTTAAWISGLVGLLIILYAGFHWKQWFKADPVRFKGADSSTSLIYLFFLMAFLTHIFIDVCTTYGTQIFYPFDLYRASFHNIFVVDPLYTLPLLLGIVGVVSWGRVSNTVGLIISSGYMLFTFWNAAQVKEAASTAFRQNQIEVERLIATPSPMNNVLWNIVAEGDTQYYMMEYHSGAEQWGEIKTISKYQGSILPELRAIGVDRLIWFSDGFYTFEEVSAEEYVFKDLRFAFHSRDKVDTGFGFRLVKAAEGAWEVEEIRDQEGLLHILEEFQFKLWNGIHSQEEG